MVYARRLTLGVWWFLAAGCGGPEEPGAGASAALARSCEIARGDEDCRVPGTSATQCRTRDGAQHGVCVDDFANLCAGLGGPEAPGCMYDQHCDGWEIGWARCTEYGAHGPAGCGLCL